LKRWGLSIAALGVITGFFVFGLFHSSATTPLKNTVTSAPSKKLAENKEPQQNSDKAQLKKAETKQVSESKSVPFESITKDDNSLPKGTTKVTSQGVNGAKIIIYKVTYVGGLETTREKVSETVTMQPISQVTKIGTSSIVLPQEAAGPAGATALCADGSFSYALNHQGACSKHNGVSLWY
jgi:hypothetical protein